MRLEEDRNSDVSVKLKTFEVPRIECFQDE